MWVFVLAGGIHSAFGNVYATNLRLNGLTNNAVVSSGRGVTISYILNEPASGGVLLEILNGTNLVQTMSVAAGAPGALRGTNSLFWDGRNTNNVFVGDALYSVSLTASSLGYDYWTQISEDTNGGNQLDYPYAIAVNQNTNSPYYGRIFVGNAVDSGFSGQQSGIYKFNADGSAAEEGEFATGGYGWLGFARWSPYSSRVSPWKMTVTRDDLLFVDDWYGYGTVLGFDQVVSESSFSTILGDSNHPATGDLVSNLSGPEVTGTGANRQIWMADANESGSFGILRWSVGADGMVVSNDLGTVVVAAGGGSDLTMAPWDVAVDKNGKIYTIQHLPQDDPASHVLCFPAYDESGVPETVADWQVVGETNIFASATGIAVNPEASFVAVSCGDNNQSGSLAILDATNGDLVTNIMSETTGPCLDVAWDNVGNLYGTEDQVWRVFSPPGTNHATTVAFPRVQVLNTIAKPVLSRPQLIDGQIQFVLNGQTSVPYVIVESADLVNWTPMATNYSASAVRNIQITPTGEKNFYRALVGQ